MTTQTPRAAQTPRATQTTGTPPRVGSMPRRRIRWLMIAGSTLLLAPVWAASWAMFADQTFVMSIAGFLLIQLLVVAACSDLRLRRIPNWITYTTILAGLAVNLVGTLDLRVESGFPVRDSWTLLAGDFHLITDSAPFAFWGTIGIRRSLTGAVVCFAAMLLVYRLSGAGAGDVKLATAIGCLVGGENGLKILVACHIIAGATMVAVLIWNAGPWRSMALLARAIRCLLFPLPVLPPASTPVRCLSLPVPLAVFFGIGALVVLWGTYR